MPAGDRRRRRSRRSGWGKVAAIGGSAAAVAALVFVLAWPAAGDTRIVLWLVASRDMGALPSRDTWCAGSDHCWVFPQSSGDAVDYGDTGGWDLSPNGSPRAGVVTGLPVQGTTVETTTELAVGGNITDYYQSATKSLSATDITLSFVVLPSQTANARFFSMEDSGGRIRIYNSGPGQSVLWYLGGDVANLYILGNAPISDGAWHCITVTRDGNTGRIYVDGVLDATGGMTVGTTAITSVVKMLGEPGYPGENMLARAKMSFSPATLADHQADCGTLWAAPAGGTSNNKPLAADDTWTQTGGAVCYPSTAAGTQATCQPGGVPHYTYAATTIQGVAYDLGWVVEPDAVNRILYSTAIDCTNWICRGTATADATTAPDGSATATTLTLGAKTVDDMYQAVASGYTNNAALSLRIWTKCATGSLTIASPAGEIVGRWVVDCPVIGGAWTLLHAAHAAVTVDFAFVANGSGQSNLWMWATLGTVTASIWAPTLTEEPGTGLAVIPTGAAAVSTGDPIWAISNGLRNTGAQLLVDGDMEAAGVTKWVPGNSTLTKQTTNPHSGSQLLRVTYLATTNNYAGQNFIVVGKRYRVRGYARGVGSGTNYTRVLDGNGATLWIGTNNPTWQHFDFVYTAAQNNIRFYNWASAVGEYVEFDDVTIYEQESYGPYYRDGDTVSTSLTEISGTCWDPLTTTGDLLLSGLEGTTCAGIWYSLKVTR